MTSPIVEKRSIWLRLYHGETEVNFVGRFKIWAAMSSLVIVAGVVSLFAQGLNLGIDFEGGSVWEVPAGEASVEDAREAVDGVLEEATIQTLERDEAIRLRVEAEETDAETRDTVTEALAELTGSDADEVTIDTVGPSWGEQISQKAIRALVFFLVAITLYITFRFELKMAIPTLVALLHDILVTVGVYSLFRFEVTPATVIAILTILGYSIYDGIVVFDKVDENTKLVSSAGGMTYSSMVNLSLNQALMRSLNTSITALLPVASLLVVGSFILGATTLQEFALALLIGLFSGAYSSLFIASPLLAVLKERETRYREIRNRVAARTPTGSVTAPPSRRAATVGGRGDGAGRDDDGDEDEPVVVPAIELSGRVIPPRPRKTRRRR